MSCKDCERDVDDEKRKDCSPDCDTVDDFLLQVVEHSREVDRVDRRNESRSEAS